MKRVSALIAPLLLALTLLLGSCAPAPDAPDIPAPTTVPTTAPAENSEPAEPSAPAGKTAPDRDGSYYDVRNVVLYLEAYGELPANYLTKDEARALGWEGGSVEDVLPGAAIGGDRFGNYEGLLPEAAGRTWTECDIDTHGYGSRGSRRLVFSSDGLYYYTADHYASFTPVTVTESGDVVW